MRRQVSAIVHFCFNIHKATEVSLQFMALSGGSINVMKLVKLVYLLDRLSVQRRGIPVVGGIYFSMRNGPATSELLDLINAGSLAGEPDSRWEELISDRVGHEVAPRAAAPEYEYLSKAEMDLIEEIFSEHGTKDQWKIRDWCHANCGEWTPLANGRQHISIEKMAVNAGLSQQEAARISEEAEEANTIAQAFSIA